MEGVLDVYQRPYDPSYPIVCMDESPKQLIGEVLGPLPTRPGSIEKVDDEYVRLGVAELFLAVEPLTGKMIAEVENKRAKKDWAQFIRDLVDIHYPTARLLSEHHDLEIEVLCHVPFVAYGKELFGHAKQKLNPGDLDHHRLILLSSDTKMGTRSQRILKEVHYQRAVTVSSTDLALELANENLGIHITDALATPFSSEYMRPIEGELTIPFCAFWLKRIRIKREHDVCLSLMKELVGRQLRDKGVEP